MIWELATERQTEKDVVALTSFVRAKGHGYDGFIASGALIRLAEDNARLRRALYKRRCEVPRVNQ